MTGTRKYDNISPILKELHWLPVAKQLEVRDTRMAFKCIKMEDVLIFLKRPVAWTFRVLLAIAHSLISRAKNRIQKAKTKWIKLWIELLRVYNQFRSQSPDRIVYESTAKLI